METCDSLSDSIRIEAKVEKLSPWNIRVTGSIGLSTVKVKMGTREMNDYKLQKWVPYVSDPDKWYQFLLDLREGYVQHHNQGHYK